MANVSQQTLKEIVRAIFVDQTTTMEAAASDYSVVEIQTLTADIYQDLQQVVEALPKQAFQRQLPDGNVDENWSAGEITGHLFEVNTESIARAGTLANIEIPELPADQLALATTSIRSREDTRETVSAMRQQIQQVFTAMSNGKPDLTVTEQSSSFGEIGARGWLLFLSIHGRDHVHQLRKLSF